MIIKGTVSELELLFGWEELHEIIQVDYYKKSWIPDWEEFTIVYSTETKKFTLDKYEWRV